MISPIVQTLLDRMDKFPEEFTANDCDLSEATVWGTVDYTRWAGVSKTMIEHRTGEIGVEVFSPDEVDAYITKLSKIMRKKMEEDICAKLVKFEKDPRQGELPFDKYYGDSVAKHIEAHRKILGLTPTMRIKDSTS